MVTNNGLLFSQNVWNKFTRTFRRKLLPLYSVLLNFVQVNTSLLHEIYGMYPIPCKGKVKFTLKQTTKAQRGSRNIALLFF